MRLVYHLGLPLCSLAMAGALNAQAQAHEGATIPHAAAPHALPSPSVRALQRSSPITVDGRLDEPIWTQAQPATDFRQAQPKVGDPATQRTEVRILYDDDALYVGARMFDD